MKLWLTVAFVAAVALALLICRWAQAFALGSAALELWEMRRP